MEGWTSDKSQVVETPKLRSSLLGLIGKKGFFVPKDVVSKNPRLSNSDFYENYKNREFIANTFKRPVSWQEYCDSYFGKVADDPERICPIPTTITLNLPGLSSITNTDSSEQLDKKKKIFDNTYYYIQMQETDLFPLPHNLLTCYKYIVLKQSKMQRTIN